MHKMSVKPVPGLQIFLDHIIDYAGIFPPAGLPLNKAFKNYLDYLDSPFNWMISKFLFPLNLLSELGILMKEPNKVSSVSISVITSASNLSSVSEFIEKNKERAIVKSLEVRLPEDNIIDFLLDLVNQAAAINIRNLFCEAPVLSKLYLETVIKTILQRTSNELEIGFKLRTGGVESSAFPSSEQIASVINLCRKNNVKMKFTAGLHHPVRHFSTEVNTKMHGFLNVFAAGILSYTYNLNEKKLAEILNDESANNFKFSETGFSWKEYNVSLNEISISRKKFMTTFGSCSFDDPVNDLKDLDLLSG